MWHVCRSPQHFLGPQKTVPVCSVLVSSMHPCRGHAGSSPGLCPLAAGRAITYPSPLHSSLWRPPIVASHKHLLDSYRFSYGQTNVFFGMFDHNILPERNSKFIFISRTFGADFSTLTLSQVCYKNVKISTLINHGAWLCTDLDFHVSAYTLKQ